MPLALAYIMVVCVAIYVIRRVLGITDPIQEGLVLFGLSLVVGVLVFGLLDRGTFIRGSARQRKSLNARAQRATVTS
jgi:hypothetical protein